MEIGLAILLFVCMTALLYVILSLKITRQVDLQMKEFYKTRIHADMQEFYREMEGYAALFENRIQRFRSLVERTEATPAEQPLPPAPLTTEEIVVRPAPARKIPKAEPRKKPLTKKEIALAAKAAKKKPVVKQAAGTKPLRPVSPPPAVRPIAQPTPEPVQMADSDDTTIAEELMKDLFQQDEVRLSSTRTAVPEKPPAISQTAGSETDGERTMSNFFSRLGRAIEPVFFGEKAPQKPASDLVRSAPAAAVQTPAPVLPKPTSSFSEVLKRAEQIKAEKKAERERAEVEARAEFYTSGDTFSPRRNAHTAHTDSLQTAKPPERNQLVIKELDQHTVSFLIDSLVKDNGYRRQALRALTENNIPLAEIARLSKIDIGELELMRQLGRF